MTAESTGPASGGDLGQASIARVYDFLLGGAHNFAVDREVGDNLVRAMPAAPAMARANRSFLRRVVTYLVDQGINQFLDLGSGIPTVGNVHEIAQGADPDARVVYVDIEPVAVAHAKDILEGNTRVGVIEADVRDPDAILASPEVTGTLDVNRPFAVLMVAVLHWITDDHDPAGIVATFRAAMCSGSYLVVSHTSEDEMPSANHGKLASAESVLASSQNPASSRPRAWIEGLFDGMTLVDPGLTHIREWRPDSVPDPDDHEYTIFGGVGRMG